MNVDQHYAVNLNFGLMKLRSNNLTLKKTFAKYISNALPLKEFLPKLFMKFLQRILQIFYKGFIFKNPYTDSSNFGLNVSSDAYKCPFENFY